MHGLPVAAAGTLISSPAPDAAVQSVNAVGDVTAQVRWPTKRRSRAPWIAPTHVAIALQYDPFKAPAPFVLAMGQRKIAERIKQIAYENDVPVIENKPLAWALLGSAQVGAMIPAELYAAVAEVLAFIIRQRALRGVPARNYGTVSA